MSTSSMYTKAEALVRERIRGFRKGLADLPASLHSFRVADILQSAGCGEHVVLSGLLHDIVEDGDMTLEYLRAEGFAEDVVRVVGLCTHDTNIGNKDVRWTMMLLRLARTDNADAWLVKLADVADNLTETDGLDAERARSMWQVKAPCMLMGAPSSVRPHPVWRLLFDRWSQVVTPLRGLEEALAGFVQTINTAECLPKNVLDGMLAICSRLDGAIDAARMRDILPILKALREYADLVEAYQSGDRVALTALATEARQFIKSAEDVLRVA